MSEDFKKEKNNIMKIISDAGMRAVNARDTENFEKELDELIECVRANYLYYLLAYFRISPELLQGKILSDRNETWSTLIEYKSSIDGITVAWTAVAENLHELRNIVNNFTDSKTKNSEYAFFHYMEGAFILIKNKELNKAFFDKKRNGVKLSKDEEILITKIVEFLEDIQKTEFTEELVIKFAEENNISEEKARKAWKKNNECKCIMLERSYTDSDGNTNIMEIADEDFTEKMFKHEELDLALKILNMAYYKDFSKEQKHIYPYIFSNKMIQEVIVDVKKLKKAKSLPETVTKYWEYVDLPYYRDTYATSENKCVLRPEFDYTIETRVWKNQTDIANYFGFKKNYISTMQKKVINLVRKYMAMAEDLM